MADTFYTDRDVAEHDAEKDNLCEECAALERVNELFDAPAKAAFVSSVVS
jgi:hypothetical protein